MNDQSKPSSVPEPERPLAPTTFVFLGAYSEVLGTGIKLTRFGQRVELPENVAAETKLHGGLPCIPADKFDGLKFTDDELKRFGAAASHTNAPAEFIAKKKQALEILHTIREGK